MKDEIKVIILLCIMIGVLTVWLIQAEKKEIKLILERDEYYKKTMVLRDSLKVFTDSNWYRQVDIDTFRCPFCKHKLQYVDGIILEDKK